MTDRSPGKGEKANECLPRALATTAAAAESPSTETYRPTRSLSKQIARVRDAVEWTHQCGARHRYSIPIRDGHDGNPTLYGSVEVFDLIGHPHAKHCYAWEIPGAQQDYVAVLENRPVVSPQTAVKLYTTSLRRK
ncbi:MAG TPA: hypothetical protein VHD32_14545 [Candidatus Didemnitutus sp.]|nr:hypothetical protein [Candidatus Didemnitutus sp.]